MYQKITTLHMLCIKKDTKTQQFKNFKTLYKAKINSMNALWRNLSLQSININHRKNKKKTKFITKHFVFIKIKLKNSRQIYTRYSLFLHN